MSDINATIIQEVIKVEFTYQSVIQNADKFSYIEKTTSYAITTSDQVIEVIPADENVIVTLPTAVGVKGKYYSIINSGDFPFLLDTTSGETIGNSQSSPITDTIHEGEVRNLISNDTNWRYYA